MSTYNQTFRRHRGINGRFYNVAPTQKIDRGVVKLKQSNYKKLPVTPPRTPTPSPPSGGGGGFGSPVRSPLRFSPESASPPRRSANHQPNPSTPIGGGGRQVLQPRSLLKDFRAAAGPNLNKKLQQLKAAKQARSPYLLRNRSKK